MFIFNNFSTCFGHHYAHLQENKTYVTACVVLRCNKWGKLDISFNVFFVWYCVVNLDGISCVYENVVCTPRETPSRFTTQYHTKNTLKLISNFPRLLQRSTPHAVTDVLFS